MSPGKIGVRGLEYAFIGDRLSFGEETPDYRCTFYAAFFHRNGDPEPKAFREPHPRYAPSPFPPFCRPRKKTRGPDGGFG